MSEATVDETTATNGNGVRRAGRPVPANPEAEADLLGVMMVNRDARDTGLTLPAEFFYDHTNRVIFEAIGILHAAGSAVTVSTVSDVLARDGKLNDKTRERVKSAFLNANTSYAAKTYALIVGEYHGFRQAIRLGESFLEAGYARDVTEIDRLLTEGMDAVLEQFSGILPPPPPVDVLDMKTPEERPRQWLVDRLLERGDRLILSGREGGGKTTLLRQWGIQFAAGIHPFTLDSITARRVLHFDFQDSDEQSEREFVNLRERAAAGRIARGFLRVHHRRHGMNILNRGDLRWFEKAIGDAKADIVSFGPLYKIFRTAEGKKKHDEEIAEEVTSKLDEIAQKMGVAFLIEAHSPHGTNDDRSGFRPGGASLWLRWPEFGFGMTPIPSRKATDTEPAKPSPGVFLRRFRGDRDRDRDWPTRLLYGRVWPWEADPSEVLGL